MKILITMTALGLLAFGVAQASENRYPDETVTVVQCESDPGLPTGLSVTITEGGFAGVTLAHLTTRKDLGPFEDLGSVPVSLKPVPEGLLGAGVTYVGDDFELHINTDSPGVNGQFYSHLDAKVHDRDFNQQLFCEFPEQQ